MFRYQVLNDHFQTNMSTDWNKQTVAQLKAELTKRGLDTTGKKAELVERIEQSIAGNTIADH